MYLKARVLEKLSAAILALKTRGLLPAEIQVLAEAERPAQAEHGDFATNLALKLAKLARQAPRQLAEALVAELAPAQDLFASVEVAGPGFVNLKVSTQVLLEQVSEIRAADTAYGRATWGQGRKLLLEFVSANPVGPLNIVSARAAAVGDALARILESQGVSVSREYYINDAGRQAMLLGRSLHARWRQGLGEDVPVPEEGYQGDYVSDLAREIAVHHRAELEKLSQDEAIALFWREGVARMVASHQADLAALGVRFDTWFSELSLHLKGEVDAAVNDLRVHGHVFDQDGAVWFRSTAFGDDKDRVLIKADGAPAYIAADIAYHRDKYRRGFTELVDIWGPDHHGYIARMAAGIRALGHDPDSFRVLIAQQVNLLENGQPVAMSKRAGRFIRMSELVQEVGKDVARFFFLMRSTDAHLDFDLDLARKHTEENPVFYVQYAHARIASLLRKAAEEGFSLPLTAPAWPAPAPEELALVRALSAFPEVLEACGRKLEPHALAFALRDLATVFHRFYTECRVLDPSEPERTQDRLALADASRIVLRNGLQLLGVDAPESM